ISGQEHEQFLAFYKKLILTRKNIVIPLLNSIDNPVKKSEILNESALTASWLFDNKTLSVFVNFSSTDIHITSPIKGDPIAESSYFASERLFNQNILSPLTVCWLLY
ncbi:MAG: hypothetical protein AB1782_02955, partial [Cyanobacteriota bacterium]